MGLQHELPAVLSYKLMELLRPLNGTIMSGLYSGHARGLWCLQRLQLAQSEAAAGADHCWASNGAFFWYQLAVTCSMCSPRLHFRAPAVWEDSSLWS